MENYITNLFQIPCKWDEIQNFVLDHFESRRYNLNLEYWSLFLLSWTVNWESSIRGLAQIKPSLDSPVLVCLKMVLSSYSRMMQCHPSSYIWPSWLHKKRDEPQPPAASRLLSVVRLDRTRRDTSWDKHVLITTRTPPLCWSRAVSDGKQTDADILFRDVGPAPSAERVSAVLGRLPRSVVYIASDSPTPTVFK